MEGLTYFFPFIDKKTNYYNLIPVLNDLAMIKLNKIANQTTQILIGIKPSVRPS